MNTETTINPQTVNPQTVPTAPKKLIRRQVVEGLTALSRSSIYDRMNAQSLSHDPSFPKPIKIGQAAVRWVESEIQQWINERIGLSRAR